MVLVSDIPSKASQSLWKKDDIVVILKSLIKNSKIKFETIEEWEDRKGEYIKSTRIANQMKNLDKGDNLWLLQYKPFATTIFIAGKPGNIHTINIHFAPVNVNSNNHKNSVKNVLVFFSTLFSSLLPTWREAIEWPIKSMKKSWAVVASSKPRKTDRDKDAFLKDFIVSARHNSIELSTAGVPPDIVIFRLSKRTECDLRRHADKIFSRWVC